MQTQLKSQCPLWQPNEKQETFQTLEPKIFREPEAEHDACKSEYVSPASATEVYLYPRVTVNELKRAGTTHLRLHPRASLNQPLM